MVSPLLMWWVIRRVVAVGVPPFCEKGGGPNSRRPLLATLARGQPVMKPRKEQVRSSSLSRSHPARAGSP